MFRILFSAQAPRNLSGRAKADKTGKLKDGDSTSGAGKTEINMEAVNMSFLSELFGTEKPIIGLVHIQALPGDPFYKGEGMDAVIQRAKADLEALQNGGVDGVLFTNEFSMPYEKHVSSVTLAAMGMVIGALRSLIRVPFGAEAIFDGMRRFLYVRRWKRILPGACLPVSGQETSAWLTGISR